MKNKIRNSIKIARILFVLIQMKIQKKMNHLKTNKLLILLRIYLILILMNKLKWKNLIMNE